MLSFEMFLMMNNWEEEDSKKSEFGQFNWLLKHCLLVLLVTLLRTIKGNDHCICIYSENTTHPRSLRLFSTSFSPLGTSTLLSSSNVNMNQYIQSESLKREISATDPKYTFRTSNIPAHRRVTFEKLSCNITWDNSDCNCGEPCCSKISGIFALEESDLPNEGQEVAVSSAGMRHEGVKCVHLQRWKTIAIRWIYRMRDRR